MVEEPKPRATPLSNRILFEFFRSNEWGTSRQIAEVLGVDYAVVNNLLLSMRTQGRVYRIRDDWHRTSEENR